MNELIIARYLHFISFMIVFAMVFAERIMLKENITRARVKHLWKVDGIYGLFSILAVLAGLYLWFGTGKPAEFYSQNHIFLTKVGLFIIVGVLSIWPTMFYFKNKKGNHDDPIIVPRRIRLIVRIELTILLIIPLLATLMAQGVGYAGS